MADNPFARLKGMIQLRPDVPEIRGDSKKSLAALKFADAAVREKARGMLQDKAQKEAKLPTRTSTKSQVKDSSENRAAAQKLPSARRGRERPSLRPRPNPGCRAADPRQAQKKLRPVPRLPTLPRSAPRRLRALTAALSAPYPPRAKRGACPMIRCARPIPSRSP